MSGKVIVFYGDANLRQERQRFIPTLGKDQEKEDLSKEEDLRFDY